MSNAHQTTPYASVSIYGDPNGLPLTQEKKSPRPSVFSWPLSLARRYPFLFSFAISVIITGTIAAIVRLSHAQDKHNPYLRIPHNASGIVLIGHSADLDDPTKELSLDWEILGCGAYRLPTYPPVTGVLEAVGCDALDRAVDFYFTNAFEATYDPTSFPLTPRGEKQYLWDLVTLTRSHSVDYVNTNMAPFDVCSSSALIFVIDKTTNESIPIVTLIAGRAPENFDMSFVEVETTSNYTYGSDTGPTTINVHSRVVHMEARRSRFTRALTMCLFLVNCALTTCSIYITVLVIFRRVEKNDGTLFLPVTIILTIPTLRSLYPSSLPFGIFLDSFGFVPQMMTVAVCSIVLVYFVAIPNPVPERQASGDDKSTKFLG